MSPFSSFHFLASTKSSKLWVKCIFVYVFLGKDGENDEILSKNTTERANILSKETESALANGLDKIRLSEGSVRRSAHGKLF